ncbi:MAG: dihydroorotase [Chitinophagaceae bacterium]|jgi:dihydroorotase|nr:dihydroorotase [Chitinophagaceae bacterium]
MTILIRNARIVDPRSPLHLSIQDILVSNGVVSQIGSGITTPADEILEIAGLHVSPGWVDSFAHACDPGFEFRETLESFSLAAAAGGFTHALLVPNTQPAVQNKSMVHAIREKPLPAPVSLHPIGAISKNIEGKELAEMYDMKSSGAVAFSDGLRSVQSAGLLIKALQYVKAFEGVVIQVPDDQSISPHGLINEGVVSTRMGLAGKPAMAEELMVARDIKLARYADSALHFTGVSSRKSIEYIRRAKEGGIRVSASVTPYHLYFTEDDILEYDTNLKVNPPLRTKEDRQALLEALLDGTIDCVATHHIPHDKDSKICEFEYAKPGMTGLETTAGVLGVLGVGPEKLVEILSIAPRRIFRLPPAVIGQGHEADLTLFLPEESHIFTEADIRSRSRNSAFLGKTLKGRVAGIIHRQRVYLHR